MKYNLTSYQSDNKENPGFITSLPLRGASRQRSEDVLILQVIPAQDNAFWQSRLAKLTRDTALAYYQSSGSVTNAMRSAIELVNRALRIQNSGLRLEQSPETAAMMVGVLRDGSLYLAQAAHASALLVSGAGTSLFFDRDIEQRGLGLNDILDIRYYRADIFGSDYLLFGSPESMLAFEREAPVPSSVIRLVNEIEDISKAFSLTKIALGEGKVENRLLSLAMLLDEAEPVNEAPAALSEETFVYTVTEQTALETEVETEEPPMPDIIEQLELPIYQPSEDVETEEPVIVEPVEEEIGSSEEGQFEATEPEAVFEPDEPVTEKDSLKDDSSAISVIIDIPQENAEADDEASIFSDETETSQETYSRYHNESEYQQVLNAKEPEKAEPKPERPVDIPEPDEPQAPPEPDLEAIARQKRLEQFKKEALTGIAKGAGWLHGIEENALARARRIKQNVSSTEQDVLALTPFAKWAIVIIVPLLVVAIAVSIYFARGLDRQYVYYINQAHQQIQLAKESATQGEQREALVQAVVWLDQAREFNQGDTEEIIQMRNEAQGQLDKMDGVHRLMLSNAFGNVVYPDLQISHLVTGRNAVFVLDKNTGNILRFYQAGGAYLLDAKFACGPAMYGDIELGKIIDITDVQGASPNFAALLGVDAQGNLIYCSDSGQEQIAVALTPPEGGFGSIDAIHYGNDGLYLMDVTNNKIWVYRGLMELFPNEPGLYLDGTDADLSGALDLSVRREGLFVIYDDARMVFSNVPAFNGFVEAEPPNMPWQSAQGHFTQIAGLQVADNVLYFLEPSEPSISRYSYRLVPNDVLKVSFGDQATPAQNATALTVSSSQVVFIAFGSELYYAELP